MCQAEAWHTSFLPLIFCLIAIRYIGESSFAPYSIMRNNNQNPAPVPCKGSRGYLGGFANKWLGAGRDSTSLRPTNGLEGLHGWFGHYRCRPTFSGIPSCALLPIYSCKALLCRHLAQIRGPRLEYLLADYFRM